MPKSSWKKDKLNELLDSIEKSKQLAEKFRALSVEFTAIADDLSSGAIHKPESATVKANEIRSLLAEKNRLSLAMREAVKDLSPDLKKAGIID